MIILTSLSRLIALSVLTLLLSITPAHAEEQVPNSPSLVKIQGRKLIVERRLLDGSLEKGVPFIIKGSCWSPSSIGTPNNRWERQKEFYKWGEKDITLMRRMNANTVYVFLDFGLDAAALTLLDSLYRNNIYVIMTVDWDGTNDLQRLQAVVNNYKNHPAILMWAIGNEWNINLFHHKYKTLSEAAVANDNSAKLLKELDNNHPVASIYGEFLIPNTYPPPAEIMGKLSPHVDVWGLNIYRGGNFGPLFDEWRAITDKPMFFSEFGGDSFRSEKWWPVEGTEDNEMHRGFVAGLWDDLAEELSAKNENGVCLGGTVFEWSDEWWKVKEKDGGTPDVQDKGGFPTTWNQYSQPDSFANEEYFGIVTIERKPKALYYSLQERFGKN